MNATYLYSKGTEGPLKGTVAAESKYVCTLCTTMPVTSAHLGKSSLASSVGSLECPKVLH